MSDFPPVPLTLEGSAVLHQFFRFDWKSWRAFADTSSYSESYSESERKKIVAEFISVFHGLEKSTDGKVQSALFSQLGHKGDLIFVHFRDSLEALNQVELTLAQTRFYDFLTPVHSYVSVVELGLYESTRKTYEAAAEKGLAQHSPEWNAEITESLARATAAMAPRLFPGMPEAKYLCFYPMDRKRDEQKNWYNIPFVDRQRMMHDHGMIGRRYADQVRQIITGSIGMDDWEWGVTLFAEEPVVFKKLIYEMRFDEVSADYALFGQFFIGLRLQIDKLTDWLSGKL
ncbi:hydrogen peroxide-dependent heme synthase [Terracidiphilus gabretensis]|uniref:hydrogen peroxide-dependent heme synthase n=1 Tax=Terracidiphilus gabretensis TaxID=1577687 RepID=UPI00071B7AEC|nr:hydrogen peroxide-dependent heme synthase [Terracidiphilus gabretensis]